MLDENKWTRSIRKSARQVPSQSTAKRNNTVNAFSCRWIRPSCANLAPNFLCWIFEKKRIKCTPDPKIKVPDWNRWNFINWTDSCFIDHFGGKWLSLSAFYCKQMHQSSKNVTFPNMSPFLRYTRAHLQGLILPQIQNRYWCHPLPLLLLPKVFSLLGSRRVWRNYSPHHRCRSVPRSQIPRWILSPAPCRLR